jgi:hypothetical protein
LLFASGILPKERFPVPALGKSDMKLYGVAGSGRDILTKELRVDGNECLKIGRDLKIGDGCKEPVHSTKAFLKRVCYDTTRRY